MDDACPSGHDRIAQRVSHRRRHRPNDCKNPCYGDQPRADGDRDDRCRRPLRDSLSGARHLYVSVPETATRLAAQVSGVTINADSKVVVDVPVTPKLKQIGALNFPAGHQSYRGEDSVKTKPHTKVTAAAKGGSITITCLLELLTFYFLPLTSYLRSTCLGAL
jgi:hypothetical protein